MVSVMYIATVLLPKESAFQSLQRLGKGQDAIKFKDKIIGGSITYEKGPNVSMLELKLDVTKNPVRWKVL